jgi:DNA-binding MarR family transcriptional regulator
MSSHINLAKPPAGDRTDPASAHFRIADYPFYRVARANDLYTRCLETALKPRGMDQPRWRTLMILSEHSPASTGEVAERAVMKLPTIVKLLQRMTAEGLVRCAPRASDQRVVEACITARGRRELAHVRRTAAEVYAAAMNGLHRIDVDRLNELLAFIESNLQTEAGRRSARGGAAAARSFATAAAPPGGRTGNYLRNR